jgi:hypothetical protein
MTGQTANGTEQSQSATGAKEEKHTNFSIGRNEGRGIFGYIRSPNEVSETIN